MPGCVVVPGCVVSVVPGWVPGAGASPGAAVDWGAAVALICLPGSTETGPELAAKTVASTDPFTQPTTNLPALGPTEEYWTV